METKRCRSPSSDASGQQEPSKRLRLLPLPVVPYRACIHCLSTEHDFTHCEVMCVNCGGLHAHRRCPLLAIEVYTPGAFRRCVSHKKRRDSAVDVATELIPRVSVASVVKTETSILPESLINPDRVAMIAATPIDSEPVEKPVGMGPSRSGTNTLPLGPKQPSLQASVKFERATQAAFDKCMDRISTASRLSKQTANGNRITAAGPSLNKATSNTAHTEPGAQPRRILPLEKLTGGPALQPIPTAPFPFNAANYTLGLAVAQPAGQNIPPGTLKAQPVMHPPPTHTPQIKQEVTPTRDTKQEAAIFAGLEASIRQAIRDASSPNKPYNSAQQVDSRVQRALATLKPVVLGEVPNGADITLQRATETAKKLLASGGKFNTPGGNSFGMSKGNCSYNFFE